MQRRLILATLPLLAAPALAQTGFPSRPIRVVSPFSPGGTSDGVVRLISPTLERLLGQPVVLENRAGAGGTVGTGAAMNDRPDGHTLVLANAGPLAIAATLFPTLPYDPRRLSYVMLVGGAPMVVGVRPGGPIRNMADYLAAARERPEAMTYGSAGVGSVGHLSGLLWARQVGVELLHIPFRGGGEAEQAILGGSLRSLWNTLGAHAGSVRGGTLQALAVTGAQRMASFPDVPSIGEAGFPEAVAINWFALAAPPGTPAPAIERLREAFTTALNEPGMRDRILGLGVMGMGDLGPAETHAFVSREIERWAPVVRASGATPG
ncbi:MAG: tripartite tricarboxylate transporter substrate binding protein [Alphaproteobacteria bacterium]|nr:tripartite tricarboxylate transporter substrate binding protein [Alphaproteobacteria bacterium]